MRLMAEKNIGLVVVTEARGDRGRSFRTRLRAAARACRKVSGTSRRSPTSWSETSSRLILSRTFADCLKLMHEHRIRHLPVVENGTAITVISIRDLLSEAVAHHAKIIGELERERLTMLISTA